MNKIKDYQKGILTIAAAALALFVFLTASFVIFYLHNVEAQTFTPAAGPGWIRFSSDSYGGASADAVPYGVFVTSDGTVVGEAWSDNYGWLSFNQADLTNCPLTPCRAVFSASTGQLSGWAKFLGADSWVSLRGTINVVSLPTPVSRTALFLRKTVPLAASLFDILNVRAETNYGVNFDPSSGKITGVAWSDNAGWIVFGDPATPSAVSACADCLVMAELLNQPPTVVAGSVTVDEPPDSWCAASPFYETSWQYNDPEPNPTAQASARIDFIKVGDTTPTHTANTTSSDWSYTFFGPLSRLAADTEYRAWVTVSDGAVESLAPASSSIFRTPQYYYPLVDFNWSPSPFSAPAQVTFNGNATDRSGGAQPISWQWEFSNAAPARSSVAQPTMIRIQQLPAWATSTVIQDSHQCILGQSLGISGSIGPGIKRRIFKEL
ncbi:MAG: hypothetical protein UY23_C0001G0277 [Candidatus Jorgensenbacteria bacterium GW2011_GWA1_48_11]|uniref:PKD domain-containing protein n=1 Tax=Candidatus Jorgensenbacteria bacterium GW2011_GWA1_48_11 TaxID=1618660 RepID=A0A0G1UBY8_9BACT|nr:MAG: hypothetical protein UY23_C0001G0277 [Candidatus Jorgensenbacteria bacterium GW2011_GWA1_48_11]KKW12162.1 MAG: hypothetical protein UY51_C0005G0404 [Candidatus Jorgensenbacteria bacterium GW2011_GWB1_49_9]